MENCSTINSLREINQKIFFNLDQDINFNPILLNLLENEDFNNDFDTLIFINLLEQKNGLSCSEKIFLNRIKSKIFMDYFMSSFNEKKECNNCEKKDEDITPDEFKEYFLKNNKTIELISSDIKFPKEGKLAKIRMKDNTSFPGNEFSFYLIIDHLGNILEMEGKPIKIKNDKECFQIYDGLLGKMFNYQQAVKDEQ